MTDHTRYPGLNSNTGGVVKLSFAIRLFALILLTTLAACGGSGGESGSSSLAAPLSAGIDENVQRNPENVINAATANAVEIDVVFGPDVQAGQRVTVVLTDGVNEVFASADAVPNSTVTVGPIDASLLNDGAISMIITMSNGSSSNSTNYGTILFKDTTPPALPTMLELLAGSSNPAGVANLSNEAATDFQVTFDAAGESQDLVSILVDDTQTIVTSPAENVIPSGTVAISGVDLSALLDGNLTITAEIVDPSENKTTFQILGLKDTTTPGVVLARVVTGSSGQPNTVSQDNLTAARVDVAIDSTAVSGDQVALNVIDINGTSISASAQAVAPGGATLSFTGLDLSTLADGTLILEAVVSDNNGNSVPNSSFTAMKDASTTTIESAYVAAGANNALHVVNSFNVGEFYVEVNATSFFDEDQSEQIRVVFTFDTQVVITPFVATAGAAQSMLLGPFSLAGAPDSDLNLAIEIRDSLGNVVRTDGMPAILDANPPRGINSAFIPATGNNPVDIISGSSQSNVGVAVNFKADTDDRTATVSLIQGSARISAAPITVPQGGGAMLVSGFDASSFADGSVEIEVYISDDAGNFFNQPGRTAQKDSVAVRPTSAFVAAGLGNAQGIINISQVASTTVSVTLPGNSSASENYQVIATDGSNTVISGTQPGASGATLQFSGLDLSGLADGSIALNVRVFDGAGNMDFGTAGTAFKDATAPVAPTVARVAAGANNPIDRINADTEANAVVEVRMPSGVDINDQMTVTLSSGSMSVHSESVPCPKSNTSGTFTFDTTSLPEGPVAVTVAIYDNAGNTTNFAGIKAVKDLSVVQPVAAAIAAGASNPSDTINSFNAAAVSVTVSMPAATVGGERVSVILSDGANTLTSTQQAAAAGSSTMTFVMNASSLVDGPITVSSSVFEPSSGNSTSFSGTPATKDTVAPAMVDAVLLPASGTAPQGYVNAATVGAVTFRVSHGSQFDGTETLDVTVAGPSGMLLSQSSRTLGANAAIETFSNVDMSSLGEGGIGLSVTTTDLAGNTNQQTFALAVLDTFAPETIISFNFDNPSSGVINSLNETAIQVSAAVSSTSEIGDSLRLTFTSNGQKHESIILTQDGSLSQWRFSNEDLSGLPDGTVVISGRLLDLAGNETLFTANSLTKDSSPPAAALSAHVNAGGSNPMDFVNAASAGSVSVDVAFAASSISQDRARLTISDGVNSNTTSLVNAPNGAGTLTFGPFNLGSYNEGAINLTVELIDPAGNTVSSAGTSAIKDTVAPPAPTSLMVVAGTDNNANYISAISATAALVEGVWPGTADGTESALINIGSVMGVATPVPMGGGNLAFAGLDVSSLSDGVKSLSVTVTDPAGNITVFVGTLPTMDTVPPVAPTVAQVAAGASNSADVINSSNFSAVQVDVTWPAGSSASDTASVRMMDGVSTLSSLTMNASPSATTNYSLNLSSFVDGAVTLDVVIRDPAGNTTTFNGTAAVKDTVAPIAPTSASVVVSAGNNADEINAASEATVQVDVIWPGTADVADSATVTLRDGVNPDVVSAMMAPVVSGTTNYVIDSSTLNEGSISVIVDVTDVNGNTSQLIGTSALKDTVQPLDPTSGGVAAGTSNSADIVNENNVTAAQIDVVWPAGSLASDTFEVAVDDGGAPLTSTLATVTPGATASVTMDLSTLGEGALNLNVTTYDLAGNSTVFAITSATKDTTDPIVASAANVAISAGNNLDEINAANEAAVQVDVAWPGGADALDNATVTLDDGVNAPVVSGSMAANPGNTVSYTIDSSTLNEGSISILVTVTDPNGNVDTMMGTAAMKDVTAPVAPTSAAVAMTGSNPADFINENNVSAVGIDVAWPAGADATATATVTIDDGVNAPVVSGALAVNPSNTVAYSLDASTLDEGMANISITVDITDPFGNTTSSAGTAASKDVTDPVLATAAQVMAGTGNSADIINENNDSSVMVEVTWPGGADALDSATITIGDGVNADVVSSAIAPAPGTTTVYTVDASTLNEGAITVTLSVTDVAGNNDTFAGTAATKDVTDPEVPTGASVAVSAGNNLSEINAASEAAVQVDVVWSGTADALDGATVTLDDGVNTPVVSGSMAANPGNTVSYTVDSSTLNEGSITILVTVTDPNGNVDTFSGTSASKDVTAPVAPTSAAVAMTSSNPADTINENNFSAVGIDVVWPAGADATATATVTIDDGVNAPVVSGALAVNPSNTVAYSLDATTLDEGTANISITVDITDPFGNTTSSGGTAASKDVTDPVLPTGASVAVSAGNNVNEINAASEAAVQVDVVWSGGADALDSATVTLDDGVNTPIVSSAMAANPGNTVSYSIDSSSLNEGSITILLTVTDPNGNIDTFSGTSASKDVTAPVAPTSAAVSMTGSNPADFINENNVSAVGIDVAWPAGADATATATVTIDDGVNAPVVSGALAVNPSNTVAYSLDASTLDEGMANISITVDITDPFGNTTSSAGTAASKDVTDPVLASAAQVMAGTGNSADIINENNDSSVMVEVTWPGGADALDSATITIGDGVNADVVSSAMAPNPGTTTIYTLNASTLDEGSISITLSVTDVAGNNDTFAGTAATKDVTDPVLPTGASVAVSAGNNVDEINAANEAAVQVDVVWSGGADALDSATVTIGDGVNTPIVSGSMAANPGNTVSYTVDSSTLNEGSISILVTVTDPNGNIDTFSGTSASKDVTAPVAPTSAAVAMTSSNPADTINENNVSAVGIDVAWPAGADATATATVTIDDGVNAPVVSGALAVNPSNTVAYSLDASTLDEGMANISITVDITDPFGNTTSSAGTAASKDVTDPVLASAAQVMAGTGNSADIINENNDSSVMVEVTWPGGADALDSATITIGDGVNADVVSSAMAPNPGTTTVYTLNASTLDEGSISITLSVTDVAGNNDTFSGTAATKDVTDPVLPTGASVAVSAGNNVNEINAANEAAVQVDVVWSGGADALDSATVTIGDGVNTPIVSGSMAANPGNTVSYTVDSSTLNEGSISILVTVTDPNGNIDTFSGTSASKDVTAPVAPTSAAVAMTSSNPADTINENNVSAVGIDVAWPAGADATATATVTIDDGVNAPVVSGALAVNPSNTVAYSLDASTLDEGMANISITVDITDPFGNTTSSGGTAASKDVTDPVLASAAQVMAGTGNSADIINENNDSSVMVEVTWPGGADALDSATITIGDGVNADVVSSAIAPAPGTTTVYTLDASSLNEGAITVTLSVTDTSGNNDTFAGTAATKDVTDPEVPTGASVAVSAGNNVDEINAASEAAVQVDVVWSGTADALDNATVTLDDGVNTPVVSGSMAANPGNTVSYTIDSSSLNEGSITILVTVTDPNGNIDTFSGTSATKDVSAPANPSSAAVTMTASNPADTINENNVSAVGIDVVWTGGADATATATVTIDDGVNAPVVSGSMAVNPGNTVSYSLNASSLDEGTGNITITVDVADPFGNTDTFTGTAASKDVTDPVVPTGASVAVSAGNNVNEINAASEAAVQVDVVWSGGADALDNATVTLDDGVNTPIVSGSMAANPGNTVSYTVDSSTLNEGSISILVTVTDPNGNIDTFSGTAATKDVSAPANATSAAVSMTGSNPANFINENNFSAVGIDVAWPAGADATATATVTIDDGVNAPVVSGALAVNPSNTVAYSLDASSLNEGSGNISITVDVIDPFGNTGSMTGTAASKDVTDPVAPTVAQVAAGAQNAADIINGANVAAVAIDVTWPIGASASDLATVTLSDGVNPDVVSMGMAPNPGGMTTYSVDASSLNEGAITVTVSIDDVAGNNDTFAGTAATKDSLAPLAASSAQVASGGGNAADVINSSNVAAVQVDVAWPAGANAADSAIVTLSDGSNTAPSGSLAVNPGNTVSYTIDASGLNDAIISITVDVIDTANNMTSSSGIQALKDATDPVAPTAAGVQAGASNPADVINLANEASVNVQVDWPGGAVAADMATVTLDDGVNAPVVSAAQNVAPGASVVYNLDASTLNEGSINITVDITDAVANSSSSMGTAATKDVTVPLTPTAAAIASGANNNADFITAASVASVSVDVTFDVSASAMDMAIVTLSDGGTTAMSTALAANPGATLSFTVDASALMDGPISVTVDITDVNGNPSSFMGTAAAKDSTAPGAPTLVQIPAGVNNPTNTVNGITEAAVNFAVSFPASSIATDTVTFTVTDSGMTMQAYGPFAAPAGGGIQVYTSNDLSALADGSLSITASVSDQAGNTSNFMGMTASKDSVLDNASAAAVAAGAMNSADIINLATVSAVQVDVTMPGTADGSESVVVSLFDGATTVNSGSFSVPMGGGSIMVTGINASSLNDGAITVSVNVSDPAGNMQTFVGTAATLDTIAPTLPTAASVMAGAGNSADEINASSESAVQIDVVWPGGASASDTAIVTLSDGSSSQSSGSLAANPGMTVSYTIDASSLAEGAISISVDVTDPNGNTVAFGGTAATKDTIVVTASSATIPSSATNAADRISSSNVGSVQVNVTFPASADGSETATVALSDGVNADVVSSAMPLAAGGGVVSFTGLDASSLNDGAINVVVTVTDDKQNSAGGTILSAQKDITAPSQPTAAKVVATANNADHYINIASVSAVSVELTFPAGSKADDVATITLSDGSINATAMINAPAGGGMVTATGISAAGLAEGTVTLSVAMVDGAGNQSGPFAGNSATKDVTAPPTVVVDPVTSPWNQSSQEVTGVGPQNTDIVVDGGAAQAVATSGTGGAFAITVTLTATATNSLTVYARDLAGNPSTSVTLDYNGANLDIFQDATAPSVPFSDATIAAGLGNTGAADGGAFADFDNDGDLDLFVGQAGAGILYEYDSGTGTFSDITGTAGVTFAGDSSAVWGDFDNDGDQDLLTVDSVVGVTLYRNNFIGLGTKTFTDVTVAESAGIASTTLTQAFWIDHDNDGYLDFLVLDATLNNNYLMANQRGAMTPMNSFSRDSSTGIDNNIAASAFGAAADFDVDGDVDLVFGDNTPGLFYRNDATTTFTDIAGATSNVSFDHSAGGRGIVFADYDNDGDFDLFIARGGALNVNQLWRNDGGSSFTEVAALAGIDTDVNADDICFGDVNNDGLLDLFIGSNGSNKLYLGLGDTNMDNVFEFSEIASNLGVSVDDANDADLVQMADIDNDGDLDLFVGNEGSGDVLYQNDLNNHRFIKVRLNGKGTGAGFSSKDALGAVVLLKDGAGNILATRELSGGRGKGSQDARVIHFGGVIPSVKYRIEVRFTSGVTKTIFVAPKLLPGHTFTINE